MTIFVEMFNSLYYKKFRGDTDICMRFNKNKTMYDYIEIHTNNILVVTIDMDDILKIF